MILKYQKLFLHSANILLRLFAFIILFSLRANTSLSVNKPSVYHILDLQSNISVGTQLSGWIGSYTVQVNATYSEDHQYSSRSLYCGQNTLMTFPPGHFSLTREYDSLPSHKSVYITMIVWFLDEFNGAFEILIYNSGAWQRYQIKSVQSTAWSSSSICGLTTYRELDNITLNFQIKHNEPILKITLIKTLSNSFFQHGTIGIRDVSILISNNTLNVSSFCINSPYSNISNTKECSCAAGYYLNEATGICEECIEPCDTCFDSSSTSCLSCMPGYSYNGVECILCDPSCRTCSGPSLDQCLTCYEGDKFFPFNNSCVKNCSLFGTKAMFYEYQNYKVCHSTDYYYSRNNTCLTTCPHFGFSPTSITSYFKVCEFECAPGTYLHKNGSCLSTCELAYINHYGYEYCLNPCPDILYIYSNGSCLAKCKSPLIPLIYTDHKVCYYPCSTHEYLYWNSSCYSTCDTPLVRQIEADKKYCVYPCSSLQYLYWNGTCLSSCKPPYIQIAEGSKIFCRLPCLASFYLFENGTCLPSCDFPLVRSLNATVPYCKRPCSSPNIYYYPDDKTCKSSCLQPYVFNMTDLSMSCDLPLTEIEKKQIQKINTISGGSNEATQGVVSVSIAASGDPSSASSSMLTKMLQYTKYINVTHSAKLELMFRSSNLTTGFIPLLPTIFSRLKHKLPNYNIPPIFAQYKVHSNFLFNLWEGLSCILIVLCLWTLFGIMEFIAKRLQTRYFPQKILRTVRAAIQNFFLTQFYNSYNDIILFSMIELQTNDLSSPPLLVSFVLSFFLLGFGIMFVYVHLNILLEYQNLRQKTLKNKLQDKQQCPDNTSLPQVLEKFNNDFEGMKVLFFHFKDASLIHQSFFLILYLRNTIFSLVIGLLYDYPIIQLIILTLLIALTIFYLFIKRPFKLVVNLTQQLFGEVILLIVNISLINMLALDLNSSDQSSQRENFSQVIIFCNIAIGFVAPVFGVAKVIVAVYDYLRLRKMRNSLNQQKIFLKQTNIGVDIGTSFDDSKTYLRETEGKSSLVTLQFPQSKQGRVVESKSVPDLSANEDIQNVIAVGNANFEVSKRIEQLKQHKKVRNKFALFNVQSLLVRAHRLGQLRNIKRRIASQKQEDDSVELR